MVIVTTAVYEIFARLNPYLNLSHWAELTDYTSLFKLAISYVFDKQSKRIGF
jgi:hypothetical protein